MSEPIMIGYADAITGENVIREATAEEAAEIFANQELAAQSNADSKGNK